MKIIKQFLLILFILSIAVTSFAQQKAPGANGPKGGNNGQHFVKNGGDLMKRSMDNFNNNIAPKLNLTATQKKEIKTLQNNLLKENEKNGKEFEANLKKYRTEKAKNPNSKATKTSKEKLDKSFKVSKELYQKYDTSLKKILTKDQITKLDKIRSTQMQEMRKKFPQGQGKKP